MSLNKFTTPDIKPYLNIGCNSVNCNTLTTSNTSTVSTRIIRDIQFVNQSSTPSNPPVDECKVYTKDNDKLYILNSEGIEVPIGDDSGDIEGKLNIDGTNAMTGNLNMNNKIIVGVDKINCSNVTNKCVFGSGSTAVPSGVTIGTSAGINSTGGGNISIGRQSGNKCKNRSINIGYDAGNGGTYSDEFSINIGDEVARSGRAQNGVCIGARSYNRGVYGVILGADSVNGNNAYSNSVCIGANGNITAGDQMLIKAGANELRGDNTGITYNGTSFGDFKSDGTTPMTGNLDMNTNNILDLRTTDTKIRLGNLSGITGQGTNAIAIGTNAGNLTQNQDSIAIGNTCGQTLQGAFSVGVGLSCANNNQGQQCVALGYNSQNSGSNNNSTALGALSGETNQHSKSICINANTSALNSTAEDQMKLKAGVTEFTYDVNGFVIANNVDTIGSAEGSLRTLGGITSTKNMYCGANLYVIGDVKTNLTMDNNNITNVNNISTLSLNLNDGNISNVLFLNGLSVTGGKFAMTQGVTYSTTGIGTYGTIIGLGSGDRNTPANVFQFGTSFHIKIGGIFTCANNNLLRFRFMGGVGGLTEVYLTPQILCNGAVAGGAWELEVEATVQTLGDLLTGTIAFNGNFIYTNAGANYVGGTFSATSLPFNTEIANLIDIQTSLESAGMSITSHTCIINKSY